MYKFGAQLQEWREAAKISQAELAEALDVTQQTVSGWENGDSLPRTSRVVKIADALGVDPTNVARSLIDDGPGPAVSDASTAERLASMESRLDAVERELRTLRDGLLSQVPATESRP